MADTSNEPVYVTEALIAEDIDAYLEQHQHKTMLRFITCGSVDDGKSTLIGRLLYDSKMIFEDQLAALETDSKKVGTQGQEIDFALLVDGLAAEREQGITIDVAYRFFNTEKRKFDSSGPCLPIALAVTVALDKPGGRLLAVSRAGCRAHFHLHQSLGCKADHVAQNIRIRGLLHKRAEVHHAVGHRSFLGSGLMLQPDPNRNHR